MEFDYSETIFFGIHSNFTFDSETYILSNVIVILWNLICLLILISS